MNHEAQLEELEHVLRTLEKGEAIVIKNRWIELTIEPTERTIERLGNLIEGFKAGVISYLAVLNVMDAE